jgi:hypothetical protein
MNICETLESMRPEGKAVFGIFHGSQILPRKERIKKYNYYNLPEEFWRVISLKEAEKALIESYCHHPETNRKLLNEADVEILIKDYLSTFPNEAEIRTNDSLEPVSSSFYDTTILIELNGVVGLVCIEDQQEP